MSSLAGMERTLVAVGTVRLAVMLVTVRAAAPRSRTTFCGTEPFGGVGAAGPGAGRAGAGATAMRAGAGAAAGLAGAGAAAVLGGGAGTAVLAGFAVPAPPRPAGPA